MDTIRVFITGAGSIVGQGIMKSLRLSRLPLILIAADIGPLNAALFRADEACLIPRVEDAQSLDKMLAVLRRLRPDVVMVGSEFDLTFFALHKETIERETRATVIVSPTETVRIANDKWLTAEFLRQNGLSYAPSYLPRDLSDAQEHSALFGYPVVLKPRSGTSARHVYHLETPDALMRTFAFVPNPVLQKSFAPPPDGQRLDREYSCSIFRCADGELIGPFACRRILKSGGTWVAEVAPVPELSPLLLGIAEHLPILGSLNVQLMLTKEGPVPFELNARFSGTVSVRAYFGFNEPEMAIRSYVLQERVEPPMIRSGMAISYKEDLFLEGVTATELREPFPKGQVPRWF